VAVVDALVVLVLKVACGGAGVLLFVYVLYRLVLGAKKAGGTCSAEVLAVILLSLGIGIAPVPPREVKIELKRDQDESGDPPEPTGRKAR
jgi:hypothetical protein